MKTLKAFFFSFILLSFSTVSFAQASTTIDVAGVCGMCKKKIESAATSAGASFASWSPSTKKLNVKYSNAASLAKIQQSVAAAGYDTKDVKATEAAYAALHECCRYERTVAGTATETCCADGKCTKDAGCCKNAQCDDAAGCCAKAEAGACCNPGADCCKDGACKEHTAKKA